MLFPSARLHVALVRWHAGANARLVHGMCAVLQQYLSDLQHVCDRQAITGKGPCCIMQCWISDQGMN